MKKRVNISKLIEEKYKDDSFSLKQLNEMIDSFLQESDQSSYTSKVVRNGVSDAIPENQESENIFHRMYGQGSENEIGPERPINADKIAEQGSKGVEAQKYTIEVPDIFSMITNQKIEPGDDDRKLIQKIVKNIPSGKGYWKLRVEAINDFVKRTSDNPIENVKDIRSAISSLVMLNVIKKLAFFTAQPGKLFEYVFTPIIGTEAKVMGSVDQQIIDVTKESQGEVWNYSLKLFTSEDSDFMLKGSRNNLINTVTKSSRPITYIIAVASKGSQGEGLIEFSEMLVSPRQEDFSDKDGWQIIRLLEHGVVLVKDATVGVLVLPKTEVQKLGYGQYETQPEKQQRTRSQEPKVGNLPLSTAQNILDNLNKNISFLQKLSDENKKDYLSPVKSSIATPVEEDNFVKALDYVGKLLTSNRIDPVPKGLKLNSVPGDGSFIGNIKKLPKSEDKLLIVNNMINGAKQISQRLSSEIEGVISKSQETSQQLQEAEDKTSFNISLKGSWSRIPNRVKLELGSTDEYNKQQLVIASDLGKNIESTFAAFQQLNKNLIGFFAVSEETQVKDQEKSEDKKDYGTKAIENAITIQTNVSEFQKKEKT